MNIFGRFALGALTGALTLGAAAGIYCNFIKKEADDSDSFADLEPEEIPIPLKPTLEQVQTDTDATGNELQPA